MSEEAKGGEEFNKSLSSINIADTAVAFILNLNTKTDVSPWGIIALLGFIHQGINKEIKNMMQKIFKNCIKNLCQFIWQDQLLSI